MLMWGQVVTEHILVDATSEIVIIYYIRIKNVKPSTYLNSNMSHMICNTILSIDWWIDRTFCSFFRPKQVKIRKIVFLFEIE